MCARRRFLTTATTVGALAAALPVQARGETVVATAERPTTVAAIDGRVLWSAWDASGGRYVLTETSGGVSAALPVAPRTVPFDIDAGRARGGRAVATYSRCAREPRGQVRPPLPDWTSGSGCAIYEFDLTSRRERRIHSASVSGVLPARWGDRLAFARGSRLYVADLRAGRVRRLPAGTRGGTPTALDLRGAVAAFAWDGIPAPDCRSVNSRGLGPVGSEIWTVRLPRRRHRLDVGCDSTPSFAFVGASIAGGAVLYRPAGRGDGSVFRRRPTAGGRAIDVPAPHGVLSVAADGRSIVSGRSEPNGSVVIARTD